jgi:chromosome segregation ATPase
MPPDDMDKRLREVENKVYSFEQTFGRIADDIHDIKENIQEFIEVKSKLSGIDILFKRIDELRRDIQAIDKTVDKTVAPLAADHKSFQVSRDEINTQISGMNNRLVKLEFEHENCNRLKDGTINFLSGRFGNILDWVLKIGLGMLLVYAAKYGLKG